MQLNDIDTTAARRSSPAGYAQSEQSRFSHVRGSGNRRDRLFSLCCGFSAVAIIGIYNLIFFDRYAPLPEGWFSVYADLIRDGNLPYRDTYFFLPPIYPLFITAIQAVFGTHIIALRWVGVFIMLGFTGALYKILKDCFGPTVGFFSAVAGTIYYMSGVAFIGYDFFQIMNLAALLACVSILRFEHDLRFGVHTRATTGWVMSAGVFAAMAFYTKHSNGLFITAACFFAVLVVGGLKSREWAVRGFTWYLVGFAMVTGLVVLWLVCTGSMIAAFKMIFGGASASKGGLVQIFFGFMPSVFNLRLFSWLMYIIILGLAFGFGPLWIFKLEPPSRNLSMNMGWRIFALLAGAVGLLAAILTPRFSDGGILPWIPEFLHYYVSASMLPAAMLAPCLIFIAWLVYGQKQQQSRTRPLIVPSILMVGMLWGNGTSGGVSEGGAFLGFALFCGLLLHHGGWFRFGGVAAAIIITMQMSILAEAKYKTPYDWWGVKEPDIRLPHFPANQPLLDGLWVTAEVNERFDQITDIIRHETLPGDKILVFPQTPIFYLLGDRSIMGKAVVHWFDFLPDDLTLKEKALLDAKVPALIIIMDLPEIVWSSHEAGFRYGLPCAQREMVASIARMKSEGMYTEIATFPISVGYTYHILKRR